MFEMPDYPVPEFQAVVLEYLVENCVQGKDFAVLNVISDLPADRTPRMQEPNTL